MAEEPKLTIEERYGVKYTGILARQLQQEHSILSPYVTHMPNCVGKSMQIDYTNKSEMKRILSAYQNVEDPTRDKFTARQMFAVPYYTAHEFTCDKEMYSNYLEHGVPNIITEIKSEALRKKDEQIVGMAPDADGIFRKITAETAPTGPYNEIIGGGILGVNYLGTTGSIIEELDPDKNIIAYDAVESGSKVESNMTVGKFRMAVDRLKRSKAFVPGVTHAVCAMSSSQILSLSQQLEVAHPGWGVLDMKEGRLMRLYGVDIVETELLPYMAGSTNVRCCPMFIKEHIYFGSWKDVDVLVEGKGNGRVNYGRVVAQLSFGSTRKYLQSVQEIQCAE